MGFIRITDPGMLSIVQDLGREGLSAQGIPAGGAADTVSLRLGNRLVGNPDNAAAVEMTLTGATFVFEDDALFAVAGADAVPSLEGQKRRAHAIHPWTATRARAGETLRTGRLGRGARVYLCVAGGLNIPEVLGSASTHVGAAFGGLEGRPLRQGDRLEFRPSTVPGRMLTRSGMALVNEILDRRALRAVAGAHADAFETPALQTFWGSTYTVTQQSNRVGLSLEGAVIAARPGPRADGRMISEGMPSGVVQVPPGGRPIILMTDHPTTGGYPAIGCVATADLPVLGQLRPHNTVTFQQVTQAEALALFREQESRLEAGLNPP